MNDEVAALAGYLRDEGDHEAAQMIERLQADLDAANKRFEEHLEAWRVNNAYHAGHVHDALRWRCMVWRQEHGPFMAQGLTKDQLDAEMDHYIASLPRVV